MMTIIRPRPLPPIGRGPRSDHSIRRPPPATPTTDRHRAAGAGSLHRPLLDCPLPRPRPPSHREPAVVEGPSRGEADARGRIVEAHLVVRFPLRRLDPARD